MTTRRDLQDALESWTADGGEAFVVAKAIFDGIIAALLKRFANVTRYELDLLLADERRDAETTIFKLTHNTIDRDATVDIIAQRFFGED